MGMILGVVFSYTQLIKRKSEGRKLKKEVKLWQDRVKNSENKER